MPRLIISTVLILLSSIALQAHEGEFLESEIFSSEIAEYDYADETLNKKNPAGSKWVRIRCAENSTCYPPAGFKYRNFNVTLKGSDCKGRSRRQVKMTKDYIITSRDCSVRGSIYVIPAAACRGDYRFCKS